jgi:hypothetical protein
MEEKTVRRDRFDWRLPVYAGVGALVFFVPIMVLAPDMGEFLYIVVAAPIITFVLLIFAICFVFLKKRRLSLAVLSMLVVYWAVTLGLARISFELRTLTRWLLWSKDYKAQVLTQPDPGNGIMKHIEWESRGFPGAGYNTTYLVFDPNDSLSSAARNRAEGKFAGIPCEVHRVRSLESHYYTVLFYTNSDWSDCP